MAVSVVQTASNHAVATTLTVTLGSAVTPGNTVCVSVDVLDESTSAFTVSLELGSSPDHWFLHRKDLRAASGQNIYAGVWADANTALTGQATVTVNLAGATGGGRTEILAVVYEVAGLPAATEDITGATGGNSASWTTGAFTPSASTSAAAEFWWGCVNTAGSITGPSGWTNTTLTSSLGTSMMSGYQATTSTGTPLYAGTASNGQWAAAGATLKAGTATGTAATAGSGALEGAAGIGAAAAASGEGDLEGEATGAPPGSGPMSGGGTLTGSATLTLDGSAAMGGTGQLTATAAAGMPAVVNQWAESVAQNPKFGQSLPGLASCVVPLTPAASVGGGSGIPSPGNWLFAIAGWRQDQGAGPATVNVGSDTPDWWRPALPSLPAGNTRTTIWYTANTGQVTVCPSYVYVAPNGYVAGMAVLVIEVSELGNWDELAGLATAYDASTRTLSLSVTL